MTLDALRLMPSDEPVSTSSCDAPLPALTLSAPTGPRPTKVCFCCRKELPLVEFVRWAAAPGGYQGRCKACLRVINERGNGVSRIAYALVGSSSRFYSLPRETRLTTRAHAARLYDAGADIVTAIQRSDVLDGFVYVITNPAWPEFVKIGHAINPDSRLRDYQTYCPTRSYRLEHFVYTADRRKAEAAVHAMFPDRRLEGEWFRLSTEEAVAALNLVASPLHFEFSQE